MEPEKPETKRKIHRLGDTQARKFSEEQPLMQICNTCNGTGKEKTCKVCNGRGWTISKDQIHIRYLETINREYWYADAKFVFEWFVGIGIKAQKLLHISRPLSKTKSLENFVDFGSSEKTNSPASAASNTDWDKRYQELYNICLEKFVPPPLNQHISVSLLTGAVQEGTLVSLSESNLEIRLSNANATVGFPNTALSKESRALCFRADFAALFAGKKCDAEKAAGGQLPK